MPTALLKRPGNMTRVLLLRLRQVNEVLRSAYLSVCLSARISQNPRLNFTKFSVHATVAVARSVSDVTYSRFCE